MLANDTGQLFVVGLKSYPVPDAFITLINDYDISGVMFLSKNYNNPKHIKAAIHSINSRSNTSQPIWYCIDQEGGRVQRIIKNTTRYPNAKDVAIKGSEAYSRSVSRGIATQLSQVGIHINFAPVLDVLRHPKNRVIGTRSYGAKPKVVEREGRYFVEEHLKKGVFPVLKHFPGHGQSSEDSHHILPMHSSPSTFDSHDLAPFKALIEQGKAPMIMMSHVLYPHLDVRIPASLSRRIVTGLLKQELGYKGIIFTDDLSMGAISMNFTLEKATLLAISAGVHQVLIVDDSTQLKRVLDYVTAKRISNEAFNRSVIERIKKVQLYKQYQQALTRTH